jgi:hypothetical protein
VVAFVWTKLKTSRLFAPVVSVGAEPPLAHATVYPVNHEEIVRDPLASCCKIRVNGANHGLVPGTLARTRAVVVLASADGAKKLDVDGSIVIVVVYPGAEIAW